VRRFGWLRASTPASSSASPMKMKAPKRVVAFGDPSETVDSARVVAHRHGGELHTVASLHRIIDGKDSNTSLV
jgi:hypothetical protein